MVLDRIKHGRHVGTGTALSHAGSDLPLADEILGVFSDILLSHLLDDDVVDFLAIDDTVGLRELRIVNMHGESCTGSILQSTALAGIQGDKTLILRRLLRGEGTRVDGLHVLANLIGILAITERTILGFHHRTIFLIDRNPVNTLAVRSLYKQRRQLLVCSLFLLFGGLATNLLALIRANHSSLGLLSILSFLSHRKTS